jgi:hypothetical protein
MTVDTHMIHRCSIYRRKLTVDVYRNDEVTWECVETDVACRLVIATQRQFVSQLAQFVTVTTYKLLLRHDADIQEGDRIADLVYEDQTEVDEPFFVAAILPRRGKSLRHISVALERVS